MSGFDANKRALFNRLANQPTGLLRPPWAISEFDFVEKCVSCGDCQKACPEKIIELDSRQQPFIDFEKGECTFCHQCVDSCQTEALIPAEAPWQAKAQIKPSCLSLNSTMCRSCGEICEKEAISFKLELKGLATPLIDSELCNGCGACVAICPTKAIEVHA